MSWSTSELRWMLVPLNMFKPFCDFLWWPFQGGVYFVDHFCYLCFMFIFVMLSCLFLLTLWSPNGKGLSSWLPCVLCFLLSLPLSIWCSRSGMVLDCIDSWSLLSSRLLLYFIKLYPGISSESIWCRIKLRGNHLYEILISYPLKPDYIPNILPIAWTR